MARHHVLRPLYYWHFLDANVARTLTYRLDAMESDEMGVMQFWIWDWEAQSGTVLPFFSILEIISA